MLQIQHISKQYKTGDFIQRALDDVSLNLRDSEFVAILGPSGSGKTTLLNIIGGLDRYDGGDLVINGTSTKRYNDRDWDSYRNHTVGFVFQSYNLIGHQSILSNVELALTISGVGRENRRERARKALEEVGLGDHVNKLPNQLSGGQMQRVAIARALVNDPDIILADEPTGALDSETSVQIMDLLKSVAKTRLVVMVTHNPELAEQYATRIVRLQDGTIRGDSDPYEPEHEGEDVPAVHRNLGRASMSLATSIALSFNNLKTKKGRTFLTSFAGSIGIIGIALILSVSTGVNRYIDDIQRETMTSYPLSIDAKSFDLNSIMDSASELDDTESGKRSSDAHNDGVYADDSAIKGASSLTNSITENNLSAFKKYLDNPDSEIRQYVGANGIQYSYDAKFSVYSQDPTGAWVSADGVNINKGPLTGASAISGLSASGGMDSLQSTQMSMLTGKSQNTNAKPGSFNEIMPGAKDDHALSPVVTDNYQVLSGSWPKKADQVVLVLDQNNKVPLSTLYELGLLPSSDYNDMMMKLNNGEKVDPNVGKIDYGKAMKHRLSVVPASSQYVEGPDGIYRFVGGDEAQVTALAAKAQQLDIVGVVRPVDGAKTTPLSPGVGYTRMLTNELIDQAASSPVVKAQQSQSDRNVLTGGAFTPTDSYKDNLSAFGLIGKDAPSSIKIYVDSFEDKNSVVDAIDHYNSGVKEKADKIVYTDYVGLMMDSVTTIINVITYVLIAFVGVSLVVSSIMIGIITYISVLERTKEIGILRAMGASKRNVSQVFNAETGIIGLLSGVLGIVVTLLLIVPANALMHYFMGTAKVNAALPLGGAIALIVLSVVLTLIGGIIPSRKAAKQDPATALRTE